MRSYLKVEILFSSASLKKRNLVTNSGFVPVRVLFFFFCDSMN